MHQASCVRGKDHINFDKNAPLAPKGREGMVRGMSEDSLRCADPAYRLPTRRQRRGSCGLGTESGLTAIELANFQRELSSQLAACGVFLAFVCATEAECEAAEAGHVIGTVSGSAPRRVIPKSPRSGR